jgi:hypothetical protein
MPRIFRIHSINAGDTGAIVATFAPDAIRLNSLMKIGGQ